MLQDTKTIYNIEDNLKICCGYYKDNESIYYFDNFKNVNKKHYKNMFYFIAENESGTRWNYTLNEDLFENYIELINNAGFYKKDELYKIGIKII